MAGLDIIYVTKQIPEPTDSVRDRPVEITPAMIQAGVLVLSEQSGLASEHLVEEIFRQMVCAADQPFQGSRP